MAKVKAYGKATKKGATAEVIIQGRPLVMKLVNDFLLRTEETCEVEIVMRKIEPPKTLQQIRYYFGVVVPYIRQGFATLGWQYMDNERTDYELRMLFFKENMANELTGEVKHYPASLSAASKAEVIDFIDNCIQFALQELNTRIPEPNYEKEKL